MLSKTFNSFHIIQTQNSSPTTAFLTQNLQDFEAKTCKTFCKKGDIKSCEVNYEPLQPMKSNRMCVVIKGKLSIDLLT